MECIVMGCSSVSLVRVLLFVCECMCVCMSVHAHMWAHTHKHTHAGARGDQRHQIPGTRVIGSFELPNMSARN